MSIFIHKSSCIDDNVKIGDEVKIWHFCHILYGSQIGVGCNIGQNVVIGPNVTIGKKCKIQNNVSVFENVTLEDEVFCGPSMVFTNVINPRAGIAKMSDAKPTLIRHGATLGANCTIVCGITVGEWAMIGAGSVVTHDVPPYALVYGTPARQHGWICQCGEKLDDSLTCRVCGKAYQKNKEGICELSDSIAND